MSGVKVTAESLKAQARRSSLTAFSQLPCSSTFESRERVQKEARMQRSIQINRLPRIGIKATSLSADAPVSPPARVYFALQRCFKFEFSIPRNGSRRLDTGSS